MHRIDRRLSVLVVLVAATMFALAALASPVTAIADDGVPIYRMYNRRTSEHLYTKSYSEYSSCGYGAYADWRAEGVAWMAPSPGSEGARPVWRLYNWRSGDHHYTTSAGEKAKLLASGDWRDEGTAFWSGGSINVYRVYNGRLRRGQHHYTTSAGERDSLVANAGWRDEGVGFRCLGKGKPVRPDQPGTVAVTDVYIQPPNGTVLVGSTGTMQLSVIPFNATDQRVTWSVSDTSLASIDGNGVITALRPGTVTVTATATNGISHSCEVYLYQPYDYEVLFLSEPYTNTNTYNGTSRTLGYMRNIVFLRTNLPPSRTSDISLRMYDQSGNLVISTGMIHFAHTNYHDFPYATEVDGGYLFIFKMPVSGELSIVIHETTTKDDGMGFAGSADIDCGSIYVHDYDQEKAALMQRIIDEVTTPDMTGAQKMQAICNYMAAHSRYTRSVRINGKRYVLRLASEAALPFWGNDVWDFDSYESPYILCEFGEMIGYPCSMVSNDDSDPLHMYVRSDEDGTLYEFCPYPTTNDIFEESDIEPIDLATYPFVECTK